MPPQTNAQLVKVEGKGSAESYDGPGAGPERWAGDVAVYIRDRRRTQQGAGGQDIVLDRVVIADIGDPPVEWKVGDRVTVRRTGTPSDETGEIGVVERPTIDDPDIPPELKTVRLSLVAE